MRTKSFVLLVAILATLVFVVSCSGETTVPIEKYTVVIDPQNGEKSWTVEVESGSTVPAQESPTREGYSFEGWYLEGGGTFDIESTQIKSDITIYAKWKHDTHIFNEEGICSICGGIRCGENVACSYNSDTKVLTLSGSGEMYDYIDDKWDLIEQPWFKLFNSIESLVVGEGITKIGKAAFAYFVEEETSGIKTITLPSTLKVIDDYAFAGVSASEVIIPDGTEYIGAASFLGCLNLETITIPASVIKIGEEVFDEGTALKEIIFLGTEEQWWNGLNNDSVCYYDTTFPNEGTKSIFHIIPSVNHLSSLSEYGKTLDVLEVPKTVTHLSKNAFAGSNASTVYIPEIKTIENNPLESLKEGCTVYIDMDETTWKNSFLEVDVSHLTMEFKEDQR